MLVKCIKFIQRKKTKYENMVVNVKKYFQKKKKNGDSVKLNAIEICGEMKNKRLLECKTNCYIMQKNKGRTTVCVGK